MTHDRLEHELEAIFATRLAQPATVGLRTRVTTIPDITVVPAEQPGRRFRQMFSALRLVAAGGFVALVAAFMLSQVGLPGPSPEIAAPAPSSAVPSPSASPAPPGRTIVVSSTGGGDARSIGEAAAMAQDGDTILVRPWPEEADPGAYIEASLTFSTDVTLRGDGGTERVVLEIVEPAARFEDDENAHALLVRAASVTIEDLDLRAESGRLTGVHVDGGALVIRDATLDRLSVRGHRARELTILRSNLLESRIEGGVESLIITDSNLVDSCVEPLNVRDPIVVRGNVLDGAGLELREEVDCVALVTSNGTAVLVESNSFSGGGIELGPGADGSVVRDNRFTGAERAIGVSGARDVRIEGNQFEANQTAITLDDAPALVVGNSIRGGATGVAIGGSAADLRDNDIMDNEVGITVTGTTRLPAMAGNAFCGNPTDLRVTGGATLTLDGNEVCAGPGTVTASHLGTGQGLVWERVDVGFELAHPYGHPGPDWFDERFIVMGRENDAWASSDGLAWEREDGPPRRVGQRILPWGDRRVRVDQDSILAIEEPDGSTRQREFRGPIGDVAVSPWGILAIEHLGDADLVADVLGPEVAAGDWRIVSKRRTEPRGDGSELGDRVWIVEMPDGALERIVLSEHGYGGGGAATLAWFSADGNEWVPIRDVPVTNTIAGTEAGFWQRHENVNGDYVAISHSTDGQTWERVPGVEPDVAGYPIEQWRDVTLLRAGTRIFILRPDGVSELPMSQAGRGSWRSGPLGLVSIDLWPGLVAVSLDGESWRVDDVPSSWAEPGWWWSGTAIGDDAVLVGLQRCIDPTFGVEGCPEEVGLETQLWRGTVAP